MESRKHRVLLEQRKQEIEKELKALDPLREELKEIDMLLASYAQQSRGPERGGPEDR